METLRSVNLQNVLESSANCTQVQLEAIDSAKVTALVDSFKNLNRSEMILFLIRIGGGPPTRLELEDTRNWLRANFIEDELVALPKEEVYSMYREHTQEKGIKPVSTADFGKVVRQVFTKVKARRLGQRGQSRYCYANIRRKPKPDEPILPLVSPVELRKEESEEGFLVSVGKLFGAEFKSLDEVGAVLQQQQQSNLSTNGSGGGDKNSNGCTSSKVRCLQKRLESPSNVIERSILKREDSCDEMAMYFRTDSPCNSTTPTNPSSPLQWPQLRTLLTSSTKFQPLKRHRHYSSVTGDAPEPPPLSPSSMSSALRSQSVPLFFLQEAEGDSGLSSMNNTPSSISSSGRNPMLSSSSVTDDIMRNIEVSSFTAVLSDDIEFDYGFGDTFSSDNDFEQAL